jgi:hypothetical protein
MKKTILFVMMLMSGAAYAQQKPVTGYAPVNGL